MQKNLRIRVVKREQRAGVESQVAEVACAESVVQSEREMKAVVAGWVREHRERSQDYGRALAALFANVEARSPQAA